MADFGYITKKKIFLSGNQKNFRPIANGNVVDSDIAALIEEPPP